MEGNENSHRCCAVVVKSLAVVSGLSGATAREVVRVHVTGSAQAASGARVSVFAGGDPNGSHPSGQVSVDLAKSKTGAVQLRLRVTCLAASGNLASLGGLTTEASSPRGSVGSPVIITMEDSGTADGTGDRLNVFEGASAAACSDYLAGSASAPMITSGNLRVRS